MNKDPDPCMSTSYMIFVSAIVTHCPVCTYRFQLGGYGTSELILFLFLDSRQVLTVLYMLGQKRVNNLSIIMLTI